MNQVTAYFVDASLKPKAGMVKIVLNVPIKDMITKDNDDLTAFDEMAMWDDETELKLSISDAQMSIPFTRVI